jgi:HEAT repeat protein
VEAVTYYIERARSGDHEGVFHGLRELGRDAIPAMESAYRRENDWEIRTLLVEAAWQMREPAVSGFLAEALQDPNPHVWKQALDGLVALASESSLRVLQAALTPDEDVERRAWIEEAIAQTNDTLTDHHRTGSVDRDA